MSLASQPPRVNTLEENIAIDVLAIPRRAFLTFLSEWQKGIDLIWDSPNPQAVFDAIGTKGGLLAEDSTATIHFLEGRVPGCTLSRLVKIKPFTVNLNGTITINP